MDIPFIPFPFYLPVLFRPTIERLRKRLVGPEVAREVRLESCGLLEGDLEAHLQDGHGEAGVGPRGDPEPELWVGHLRTKLVAEALQLVHPIRCLISENRLCSLLSIH